jgi:gamma-glutamylputrescine oxidase
VKAKHVVVCADRFIPELGVLCDRIDHVQTFLAVSEPLPRSIIEGLFPDGPLMVWDTKVIYHYFRPVRGDRLLVGGAQLFQTYARQEHHGVEANARPLVDYVRETFPELRLDWACVWPGMLGVSKDLLPLAGRDRQCATIHYIGAVTGLPWGAALARCVAETIAGSVDEVPPELSPYRQFALGSAWNDVLSKPVAFAVSHGLQKVRQKYF